MKEIRELRVIEELYEKEEFPSYVLETLNQRTVYAGCR